LVEDQGVTLLLSRSDVEESLDVDRVLTVLAEGFRRDEQAAVRGLRVRTDLPGPGTATALLPGLLPGIPAYTAKVNAKFPRATPALRGVVCLHSLDDGTLLAVLDSATVTAWRTGLAAALATDVLADPNGGSLGIIGAGAQAEVVLRGLTRLRRINQVTVADTDAGRARDFAARHARVGGPPLRTVGTAADAAVCEIVLLATWSPTPVLTVAHVHPGQHLTSLGFDEPGKQELAPSLLCTARLVVDDAGLARQMGALQYPELADTEAVTLGQVLRGEQPGRTSSEELTVYAPVGLPWQDLALAWNVYRDAKDAGRGTTVDLLR